MTLHSTIHNPTHPTYLLLRSKHIAFYCNSALQQIQSSRLGRVLGGPELTGAMPDARRMLEEGQWAMPTPSSAHCLVSASSSMQQWANQTSSLSQPTRLQHQEPSYWRSTLAVLSCFVMCCAVLSCAALCLLWRAELWRAVLCWAWAGLCCAVPCCALAWRNVLGWAGLG